MINKIGVISNIRLSAPTFKSTPERTSVSNPNFETNNKGLEALAAYNKSYTEELNIKPQALLVTSETNINNISGEKIYTSEGNLYSIVDNNDKTKTIYKFDKDNENEILSVKVYDNKTNKLIKEQINYEYIREFNPINGKESASTEFENGAPVYTSKTIYKNGKERRINHDLIENRYFVDETNLKTGNSTWAEYDKNKQLLGVHTSREKGGICEDSSVKFYNGSMISTSKTITKTVPNTMGRDSMNLENLEPHEKVELPKEDLRALQGEKTYYSNGFVEKNLVNLAKDGNDNYVTCYFSPDGILEKMVSDNKEVIFDFDGMQIIKENLGNNTIKETHYLNNLAKNIFVSLTNEDSFIRSVHYDENKNITIYNDDKISLYFNKEGMLENTYRNDN